MVADRSVTQGLDHRAESDGRVRRWMTRALTLVGVACSLPILVQGCDSPTQFDDLCDAIKAQQNTILYTVGFDLAGNTTALNRLRDCATSTSYFFQANTGTDLSSAFSAIAQSLNNLRVSK